MSIEANKAALHRLYHELLDNRQFDVLPELMAEDVIIHDPLAGEQQGREAYANLARFFQAAFTWTETPLDLMVGEGDTVAVLHRHPVTHTGDFMGLPPTGRSFTVPGVELYRFANGKIAEFWRYDADGYLFMQLGLVPVPVAA